MWKYQNLIIAQFKAIMYLSKENCTPLKEQIKGKEFSLALSVLKLYINSFENSMKKDSLLKTV